MQASFFKIIYEFIENVLQALENHHKVVSLVREEPKYYCLLEKDVFCCGRVSRC